MVEAEAAAAAPDEEAAAGPRGRRLWLWLTMLVLVLGGGGAGYWYYFTKADAKGVQQRPVEKLPPIYIALDPPFVVNFETEQLVRFLQVTIELMTRDAPTSELLKTHDPVIRNDLLMLFANQKYENVSTRAGKEKLRQEALETIRKVLAGAGGDPQRLEAVYFTSFVMQ